MRAMHLLRLKNKELCFGGWGGNTDVALYFRQLKLKFLFKIETTK